MESPGGLSVSNLYWKKALISASVGIQVHYTHMNKQVFSGKQTKHTCTCVLSVPKRKNRPNTITDIKLVMKNKDLSVCTHI